MAFPKVEALITVPTGGWSVSVTYSGAHTVTIPAGTYYLSSAGSGSRGLLAEFEHQLSATITGIDWGGGVTVDSSTDAGTGKVTISGDDTFALTWTSTALRDVLGFTGNLTPAAASFTGTEQAEALWMPGAGCVSETTPRSVHATSVAPDGAGCRVQYESNDSTEFVFSTVRGRWVKTAWESTANEAWETIWRSYIAAGSRFRFYADRSVATYTTHVLTDDDMLATREIRGWGGAYSHWTVTFHGVKQ